MKCNKNFSVKKNFSTTVYIEPPSKSGMKNYLVIQDTGEGNDILNECETLEEAKSWCKKCGHTIIPYESRKKNFSITNIYGIEFETIKDYAERHNLDVNHLVSLASSNGEPLSSDVSLSIRELDYYASHCRKSQQFTEVWTYPMEQIEVADNLLKALKKYIETFDNNEFKRYASESGGVSPHVAQQLYDTVAKNFKIPGPLYGADSLCFSNKNFAAFDQIELKLLGAGIKFDSMERVPPNPNDNIFPRDYWLLRFHLNDHFTLEFYFKDGKWGCGTRCTNESCPEKGKILDALNKYYPNGIEESKNFANLDKMEKITLYINDPDNNIKNMLKLISKNSLQGHSFDVVVDPDMKGKAEEKECYGKFFIDGDGADQIKIEGGD